MPSPSQTSDLVFELTNTVRAYGWGSTTHIPRFLGEPDDGQPAAELWMGAHDADSSRLPDGRTLREAIETDPVAMLGPQVLERFGPCLPFLMKVLAAAEPLSLQVHPSSADAVRGFERENALGIPLDAPDRCYRDDSHKPELIHALTRFEGMAGFRDVDTTAAVLRMLELPWADELAARLRTGEPAATLRAATTELLASDPTTLAPLLRDLAEAAVAAVGRLHRAETFQRPRSHRPDLVRREALRVFTQLPLLAERYPADPGVLVTLLLNHVVLAPGESMYVAAGVVHAYTSGLGVEIMASSDNVLRAGLTPKHTDTAELLAITDFTPVPPPYWNRVDTGRDDHSRLEPPVDEFALHVAQAPADDLPASGSRIVLVLDGAVEIVTASGRVSASQGTSIFVAHEAGPLAVHGRGRVVVGSVPQA